MVTAAVPTILTSLEAMSVRSLHRKLAEVMAEADRIPKNGTYTGQGSFKYVLVGDAADAIRKALGERKVSMLPASVEVLGEAEHATKSGGTMTTLTVRTTWILTDGETGETATIQSIGTGADSGDKASPKAQTNAMKYALLMGFLLSTGDDPEQADSSDRKARDSSPAEGESIRALGPIERTGAIAKGSGRHSDLEWRQTPDGYHIGFLLEVGDGKAKPQVSIEGPLAVSLFAAMGKEPLLGLKVAVKGELFEIKAPQRRTFYRIVATAIETDDWKIPADLLPDAISAATVPVGAANDGALPVAARPSAGPPASVPAPIEDDLSDLPAEWRDPLIESP